MKKTVCIAAAITGTLLLSACSMYAPVNLRTVPAAATQPPAPKLERVTATGSLVQPAAEGSSVSPQVPVCSVSSSCQAFDAVQYPLDCVKKIPYTNVLVPPGTQFEVVDTSGDFTCVDTGTVVNGKEVLTCYGRQLYSFELSLTNPACSANDSLDTTTDRCQSGYGFDASQNCCARLPSGADGSVTVRVNLGGCPVPTP
ncbi:MAG TPA: hypothetical protein VMJ64_18015 [Anaerolineales bacterium]|nr:hypothetical protein [Anaerolineales bacterium]